MRAISLHIGVNTVDRVRYHGWDGALRACEADATAMDRLAAAAGIEQRLVLRTEEATHRRVIAALDHAGATLASGDYFLLTFAGHGASFAEITVPGSDVDEADGQDEAWCLYDRYLLDDELHACLGRLAGGVRVCIVSDSCFSGTVTRGVDAGPARPRLPAGAGRARCISPSLANAIRRRDLVAQYRRRALGAPVPPGRTLDAHVVLLAACQEDETAAEDDDHGAYTRAILEVWRGGSFSGSHTDFVAQIARALSGRQHPHLFCTGVPLTAFLHARPFTPEVAAQMRPSCPST